jgi:hypothetical protein
MNAQTICFYVALKSLIFGDLQRKTPMTEEQIKGKKMVNFNRRMILVKSPKWSAWTQKWCIEIARPFTAYENWVKNLNEQADRDISDIRENIPEMFFRICEILEIPKDMLDRKNLVKSLCNVFIHIIVLSDDLRLLYQKSPDFLEKLLHYKKIANVFSNLKFDNGFFRSEEELNSFFEYTDGILQFVEKGGFTRRNFNSFSSIKSLFMSTDFVLSIHSESFPQSHDLLRMMIDAIIDRYYLSLETWTDDHMAAFFGDSFDKTKIEYLVEELCNIIEDIRKHDCFNEMPMMLNVLCKLLPWKKFTDFLQSIKVLHPIEHEFICLTLKSMAQSIQENDRKGIDASYASVILQYPSRGFEPDRTRIFEFVCAQL